MIRFPCHCRHTFELAEEMAGGMIQCPRCGRLNDVPLLSDLKHLSQDGTYLMEDTGPSKAGDFGTLHRAFTRQKVDEHGNPIDLRPTPDQIHEAGAEEIPLSLRDEVRPGRPKYDPETGELVRPMSVVPRPPRPVQPLESSAPSAIPTVAYASRGSGSEAPPRAVGMLLLSPGNIFVMFSIFIIHVLGDLMVVVGSCILAPLLMAGMPQWTLLLPILFLVLAHYGNTVEETGPEARDELPRVLRNLEWSDDIFRPVYRMGRALLLVYWPAALLFGLRHRLGDSAPGLIALAALAGSVFLPAVMLTSVTGTTFQNLRPDRVVRVILACGTDYIICLLLWFIAAPLYAFTMFGWMLLANNYTQKFAWMFAAMYGLLVLGVYFMHLYCWHVGLLYRGHHEQFPWVLQRHVR